MADGPTETTPLTEAELLANLEKLERIEPEDSVYSYQIFMVPVEEKRAGSRCSWIIGYACSIVVVNLFMQFVLLCLLGPHISTEYSSLVKKLIRQEDEPWFSFAWLNSSEASAEQTCRDSESLCWPMGNGEITCAPPSVQVLGNWSLLDTNGDGIWARSEAADPKYVQEMLCQHNVNLVILFDDIVADIRKHPAMKGRLHPSLVNGTGLHRAYVNWFLREPMLCLYGDKDMCGAMFARGVFDAVLADGVGMAHEHEITNFQSARDYCAELLGGRCEQLLPSTYRVWKEKSEEACGAKTFTPVQYDPPDMSPRQWLLKVDYEQHEEYQKSRSWPFALFLSTLVLAFFSTMLDEAKKVYRVMTWVCLQPTIHGDKASVHHRLAVFGVTVCRAIIAIGLFVIGIMFLTEGTRYVDLIFDALSLVFIISIDELLYDNLLPRTMQLEHLGQPAIKVHIHMLYLHRMGWEFLRVGLLISGAFLVVLHHMDTTMETMRAALECVCVVEGDHCHEATTYTARWWEEYWLRTLPISVSQIRDLMRTASGTS